ncbi:MAG: SDR family NAD(P)-dependent oxidoreductase, partial [Gaiellales bacterium]
MTLSGKVAVVTGAGAGLGRAAAIGLARAGANVVVNDLDGTAALETVARVEALDRRAVAHVGDVSDRRAVAELIELATSSLGGLDFLNANAAVSIYHDLASMPEETLDRILDVDLRGPLICAQLAIPRMRERGGGSIVFVSSVQAFQALPGSVPYAAAKAALVAAARALAVEVGPHAIRVNAIAPGTIDTPMLQRDLEPMDPRGRDDFLERVK